MAEIIRVDGVDFAHGDKPVLRDVTFGVGAGETVVLLGPSGVGKSTLLKLLAGLLQPSAGTVSLKDAVLGVGPRMVFQEPRLFPWMTVRNNVYFALRSTEIPESDWPERVSALLDQVGLTDELDAMPSALSMGMAQRVALVRALVCQPSVLLLDEPFSALDPKRRAQLRQDLARLVAFTGVSVVMVTHDINEALEIGDLVLVLDGQPAQVISALRPASMDPLEAQARMKVMLLG